MNKKLFERKLQIAFRLMKYSGEFPLRTMAKVTGIPSRKLSSKRKTILLLAGDSWRYCKASRTFFFVGEIHRSILQPLVNQNGLPMEQEVCK